ncbi:unnamed protein product [Absidia cylindrospora]
MMASTVRAAAKQLDWSKLSASLPQETVASLQAFKKRNDEVKRVLNELQAQLPLSTLPITAVQGFKPVAYNLDGQLKAIDQFETKAVEKAKTTVQQIDVQLKDSMLLSTTLKVPDLLTNSLLMISLLPTPRSTRMSKICSKRVNSPSLVTRKSSAICLTSNGSALLIKDWSCQLSF